MTGSRITTILGSRTPAWRVAFLAGLLALAVGLLAGCGGGDEESPAADTAAVDVEPAGLAREEVIRQGDAICAEVNAALAGLETGGASPAVQMSQRVDLYEGMMERLRGLDRDDPALTEVFATGRDLIQAAEVVNVTATTGDAVAVTATEGDLEAAVTGFQIAATSYGFTECGADPRSPAGPPASDGGDGFDTPGGEDPAAGDGVTDPGAGDTGDGAAEPPAGGGTPDGPAQPDPAPGGATPDDGGGGGSDTGGFSPG